MRKRLILGIGALVVAASFLLVAMSHRDPVPRSNGTEADSLASPTQASLAEEPEARLAFPGSTEFEAGGHDAYSTIESDRKSVV